MTHVSEYNGMHQLKILIIRFVFVFQYIYIHTPGYAGSFQVDLERASGRTNTSTTLRRLGEEKS